MCEVLLIRGLHRLHSTKRLPGSIHSYSHVITPGIAVQLKHEVVLLVHGIGIGLEVHCIKALVYLMLTLLLLGLVGILYGLYHCALSAGHLI